MEKEIAALFKTISENIQRRRDNDLKEWGLTFTQARVLRVIYSRSGEITQKDIEKGLMVSHAAAHGIISRLIEKGYIGVYDKKDDKRQKVIYITGSGAERVAAIKDKSSLSNPINCLTYDEKVQLKGILTKIIDQIRKNESE